MSRSSSPSSSPPPVPGPIQDRFDVYNPQLYRELLGASDWSQAIEKARSAKRDALLAQHHDEEQAAMARRAEQEVRSKEEQEAVEAERKRARQARREERDIEAFKARTEQFFARHEELMDQLSAMESDSATHEARVREKLYHAWESEVFLPIQAQVNNQIDRRAAETASLSHRRPHPSTATVLVDSGETTPTRLHETNRRTSARGHPDDWASRKAAMWNSFIAADNRRRKGHEKAGLFLDDDTLAYDPARQRDALTIRYRLPKAGESLQTASSTRDTSMAAFASSSAATMGGNGYLGSSVDQSRRTALDIERQYDRLAQQYRMSERESRTGKLVSMAGGTHDHLTTQRVDQAGPYPQQQRELLSRRRSGDGQRSEQAASGGPGAAMPPAVYRHDSVRVAYQVPGHGRHASTVEEATLSELVPRTYVPYDLSKNSSTLAVSRRAPGLSTGQTKSTPPTSAALPVGPKSFRELVAAYAGGFTHEPISNRTAEEHVKEAVSDMQTRWSHTFAGESNKVGAPQSRLAESSHTRTRAMPLPLPGGMAERAARDSSGEAVWARDGVPRDVSLPVSEWGGGRLPSTIYGHNVNPDGSQQVPSDRKVAEGFMKTENTTVLFDHFNYPKGMQPQHYGKRMEVWRQL